jgi:cytochrome P450
MSHLLHSGRPTGDVRRVSEILPTLKIILFAGMQEPRAGASATMLGLLQDPAAMRAVRATPDEMVPRAVEEGLRWVSPVGTQTRQVRRDTELGGVTLPTGAMVGAVLSSANRDERHFSHDPSQFVIGRPESAHAAFGFGMHHCVGQAFARTQMTTAITALLDEFPDIALDRDQTPTFHGWEFRALTALHVRLGSRR